MVPAPYLVKVSSNNTCGIRPSRMCAASTSFSMAWIQVSILGIMPPEMIPSLVSLRASLMVSSLMSSLSLFRTPATSVSMMSLAAPRAAAIAPAAVSALML